MTGRASARDLGLAQLCLVLDELRRLSFREGSIEDKESEPQHRLIRALWADLQALGALRDGSERAGP